MIHLVAQQLFDGVHHSLAAGDDAVDIVGGMVPERQVGPPPGRVFDSHRVRLQHAVGPTGRNLGRRACCRRTWMEERAADQLVSLEPYHQKYLQSDPPTASDTIEKMLGDELYHYHSKSNKDKQPPTHSWGCAPGLQLLVQGTRSVPDMLSGAIAIDPSAPRRTAAGEGSAPVGILIRFWRRADG